MHEEEKTKLKCINLILLTLRMDSRTLGLAWNCSIGVRDGPALAGPLFQLNDNHHYYPCYIKTVTMCVDVDAYVTREFSLWRKLFTESFLCPQKLFASSLHERKLVNAWFAFLYRCNV